MLVGPPVPSLRVLFGRAFLIAIERKDRAETLAFARALLTQFPAVQPR